MAGKRRRSPVAGTRKKDDFDLLLERQPEAAPPVEPEVERVATGPHVVVDAVYDADDAVVGKFPRKVGNPVVQCPMGSDVCMSLPPRSILLAWRKRPVVSLADADTYGYVEPAGYSRAPHFGVLPDGNVVQFLDPGVNGSDMAADYDLEPHQTVVIAQMGTSRLATDEQVLTANRLVDEVGAVFWSPSVVRTGKWSDS